MFICRVLRNYFPLRVTHFAKYCTEPVASIVAQESAENSAKKTKKGKKEPRTVKIPNDILRFFAENNLQEVLSLFPNKLLGKKHKIPEHFYIIHPEAANIIAKHLIAGCQDDQPLIEVNPGCGVLTEKLFKSHLKSVRLYEVNDEFMPLLKEKFIDESSERFQLKSGDFIGLWKLAHQDKFDHKNRVDEFMLGLPYREWNKINFRVFACTNSLSFFKHLINATVAQTSLMSFGRSELFIVMSPLLYIHLTCNNEAGYMMYRSTSILFQIMFEHYFIEKIPKKYFLPWFISTKRKLEGTKLEKFKEVDQDYLYLIRIVPRHNLFQLCYPEDMQAMWFFVKQHCTSRKNKIIPTLEKWIPGAGPRLIMNSTNTVHVQKIPSDNKAPLPFLSMPSTTMSKHDYFDNITIFTEFGDLSPSQLLTLFHQFKSWPGYKNSPFLTCMENNFLKMETSGDSTVDGIDLPEEADDEDTAEPETNTEKNP